MNEATKNKFADILKAAQDKAQLKSTTNFKSTEQKKELPVKEFGNLNDITNAANTGEVISISNLLNIIKDEQKAKGSEIKEDTKRPELSNFTFDDIMSETIPKSIDDN